MAASEKNIRSMYVKHDRFQTINDQPSRAKQSFAAEVDINNILKQHQKTGLITHINTHGPRYEEMPNYESFHEAMTIVTDAQEMFAELPSSVRARFQNDPSLFLNFVDDDTNREEMIKMGLIAPEVVVSDPPKPPAATEPPETADASPDAS